MGKLWVRKVKESHCKRKRPSCHYQVTKYKLFFRSIRKTPTFAVLQKASHSKRFVITCYEKFTSHVRRSLLYIRYYNVLLQLIYNDKEVYLCHYNMISWVLFSNRPFIMTLNINSLMKTILSLPWKDDVIILLRSDFFFSNIRLLRIRTCFDYQSTNESFKAYLLLIQNIIIFWNQIPIRCVKPCEKKTFERVNVFFLIPTRFKLIYVHIRLFFFSVVIILSQLCLKVLKSITFGNLSFIFFQLCYYQLHSELVPKIQCEFLDSLPLTTFIDVSFFISFNSYMCDIKPTFTVLGR